jgi:hypothetical protein
MWYINPRPSLLELEKQYLPSGEVQYPNGELPSEQIHKKSNTVGEWIPRNRLTADEDRGSPETSAVPKMARKSCTNSSSSHLLASWRALSYKSTNAVHAGKGIIQQEYTEPLDRIMYSLSRSYTNGPDACSVERPVLSSQGQPSGRDSRLRVMQITFIWSRTYGQISAAFSSDYSSCTIPPRIVE